MAKSMDFPKPKYSEAIKLNQGNNVSFNPIVESI